jgi:hypothetical protein
MKKFAAGILTVFCATALSIAQPIDQSNEQVANPQVIQTTTQTSTAQAYASATITSEGNTTSITATAVTQDEDSTAQDSHIVDPYTAPHKRPRIGIGARAAFIYGNFWGFKDLEADGLEPPTGFGGEFGVVARYAIVDGLQFSPEITFRIFNLSHDEDEIERCYNQMFLDFSFYIRGILGGGFFLEVAPQISINTSSEYTYDGHKNKFERIEQAAAEFGLNFGAGYYILDNLSLNFRWYMGFTEVFPDVKYDGDMNSIKDEKSKSSVKWASINLKGAHTMMFKFGVTYWFI